MKKVRKMLEFSCEENTWNGYNRSWKNWEMFVVKSPGVDVYMGGLIGVDKQNRESSM